MDGEQRTTGTCWDDFSTQTFSLPRLARAQNYFLRLYDNSSPPRYSRYAAALHVDYPL